MVFGPSARIGIWIRDPDELRVLKVEDPDLARAAEAIDQMLSACPFMTIVHGDAKLANFCFSVWRRGRRWFDFNTLAEGAG